MKKMVFILLALALLVGGCTQLQQGVAPKPTKVTEKGETAKEEAKTSAIPQVPKMIRTATVEIEVSKGEFEKKFEQAQAIAEQFGGYVTSSNAERVKGELASGTVTIRVPEKKFLSAINQVKKLGKVNKAEIKGEDVTEEYVDLESRLRNYKAQEKALLELMNRAQTVADTLAVQTELTKVQEQIETITGRLNYLQNRVDFSTITITIEEPGAVVPTSEEWGFVDALRTAARAFIGTINGIIIVLGALAPIIILGVIVWYLIRWWLRGRKMAKPS